MGTRAPLILALLFALHPMIGGADICESETVTGHQEAACSLCHASGRAELSPGSPAGGASEACLGCHAEVVAGNRDPLGFHDGPGSRCTRCHRFHDPSRMNTSLGEGELPTRTGVAEDHCAACHAEDAKLDILSPGHRAAARLYHGGALDLAAMTPSEACLSCHSSQGSPLPLDLIPADTPSFNEHASHAYGIVVMPGAEDPSLRIRNVLDPRIRLFDQRIECASCHRLDSRDEDLLVEFESRYGLCQGCHEHGLRTDRIGMLALGR